MAILSVSQPAGRRPSLSNYTPGAPAAKGGGSTAWVLRRAGRITRQPQLISKLPGAVPAWPLAVEVKIALPETTRPFA
jgi:hypothetical protein